MDIEKLRSASSHRRTAPASVSTEIAGWHCNYCKKTFKREGAFMSHHCAAREKMDKLRSSIGQAAYAFYSDWMKAHKRSVPTIETFSNSRYFNAFYRFAENAVKVNLAHPDVFIKLMVERDWSPMLWTRDQSYAVYLKHLDTGLDPLILVQNSVEYLLKISELTDVPLDQVFSLLSANELADLIRKRELSEWLLFCSGSFKKRLASFDDVDRKMLADVINPTYWTMKFEENPKLVDDFRKLAIDIGI